MDNIRFFDCNCAIGRRTVKNECSFHDIGDLVRNLNSYGIERAMVYHTMAKDYCPTIGNQILLDEIQDFSFLNGVWVVLPHHTDEFPEPSELRRQMREKNIKAVRMYPSSRDHKYSFSEWCCGDLFDMLEQCRIPLMLDLWQISWNELHDTMSTHPELRVILTDLHYAVGRNLYPLLKKFEHLYVETIGYKVFNGIEELCRKFGAERLIFGSNTPIYSEGAAISMINYAAISHEEKCKIAGGNLEKLLGGVSL